MSAMSEIAPRLARAHAAELEYQRHKADVRRRGVLSIDIAVEAPREWATANKGKRFCRHCGRVIYTVTGEIEWYKNAKMRGLGVAKIVVTRRVWMGEHYEELPTAINYGEIVRMIEVK